MKTQRPKLTPFYEISRSKWIGGEAAPKEVMVTRFTDSSVWLYRGDGIADRQQRRFTEYDAFYPTLNEAIAASRQIIQERIGLLKKEMDRIISALDSARAADAKWKECQETGKGRVIKWCDPNNRPKRIKV